MIDLIYKNGNLFDVINETNAYFIHSCNSKCMWGAGIAAEFKRRFPTAFQKYCDKLNEVGAKTGSSFVINDGPTKIACLIVSVGWGKNKDPEKLIIENTKLAIEDLVNNHVNGVNPVRIHSPKINSGLFNIPWNKTETTIKNIKIDREIIWTVWDLQAGNLVKV